MNRIEEIKNMRKFSRETFHWTNKDIDTLLAALEERDREIATVLVGGKTTEEKLKELQSQLATAREALEDIKLWCEVAICDCGEPMKETDCYMYVMEALRGVVE